MAYCRIVKILTIIKKRVAMPFPMENAWNLYVEII